MSQIRKDQPSGRWVIIASDRSKRPDDFRPPQEEKKQTDTGFCPFCEGNEPKTPPEVFALGKKGRAKNRPGWRVRVVPNKFPALQRGTPPKISQKGLFQWMDGVGVHEVIIETPSHEKELSDLSFSHISDVLWTYGERIKNIEEEWHYQYVHVFKNKGKEAGASLSHPHSQIVATPIIPKKVYEELNRAEWLFLKNKECIFCGIIEEEFHIQERLVLKNEHFCAIVPFAPRFPFEMRVYPLRHSPYYIEMTKTERMSLARLLKTLLLKMKNVLSDPPYNYYIHQAPNPSLPHEAWPDMEKSFHWHMEIIPVLTRAAGFEWGTGFYINPVSPETAAKFLRESTSGER